MLGANFLLNLFKYKKNRNFEIIQYDLKKNFTLQDQIEIEIRDTDKKISENSKALVEAQLVKLRSIFSKSNNFIEKIGKNVYKTKIEESIHWHQKNIKNLYIRRRELAIELEKLQGIFWLNQIKRLSRIILLIFLILLILFILFSSFILLVNLIPFILFFFIGYLIFRKKY